MIWYKRSIGNGVLLKTFDVKVQVHIVPETLRQTFLKSTPIPMERHIMRMLLFIE